MSKTKDQLVAENTELEIRNQSQKSLIENLERRLQNVPECSSCPHQMKATNTAEEHAERIEKLNKQIKDLLDEVKRAREKSYSDHMRAEDATSKLQAAYQETVYARQQLNDYRANNPFRTGLFQMIDMLSLMKKDIKLGEEINKR